MRAGRLRHRVVIQDYTESQNTYGEATKNWTDYATVWAAVEPIKGREFWQSQQVNAEIDVKITMRYITGVKPKMRVVSDSRIFEIEAVINVEERNRELQLLAKESVE
jgi:SPP1 family predicted phage head-tail adaptor